MRPIALTMMPEPAKNKTQFEITNPYQVVTIHVFVAQVKNIKNAVYSLMCTILLRSKFLTL